MEKKKTDKVSDAVKTLDDIYLDISDNLRSLRLERMNLDSLLAGEKVKLEETESLIDPNRKLFHVAPKGSADSSADLIRQRIFELEEECRDLDSRISDTDRKLKSLHKARKLITLASENDSPTEEENTVVPVSSDTTDPQSQKGVPDTDDNLSEKERNSVKRRLASCIDGIELASRVTGFDPERARVELAAVIKKIQEIRSAL